MQRRGYESSDVQVPLLLAKLKYLFEQYKGFNPVGAPVKFKALTDELGFGKNYFHQRAIHQPATLPTSVSRYIALRYGFGPSDGNLNQSKDVAWLDWEESASASAWAASEARSFNQHLSQLDFQRAARSETHPLILELKIIVQNLSLNPPYESNGHLETQEDRARLASAFEWVIQKSVNRRKTGVPVASHLMQVCGLVLENNGSLEQAIAALLHDVLEDYEDTSDEVLRLFGHDVLSLVKECSDSTKQERSSSRDWFSRKVNYLDKMRMLSEQAALIVVADKLHNARATLRDGRLEPERLIKALSNETFEERVAYFAVAYEFLRDRYPSSITNDLGVTVSLLVSSLCDDDELAIQIRYFRESVAKLSKISCS